MSEYTARLPVRIRPATDERLRLLATVQRQPLQEVLDQLLDRHLPSMPELAAVIAARGTAGTSEGGASNDSAS